MKMTTHGLFYRLWNDVHEQTIKQKYYWEYLLHIDTFFSLINLWKNIIQLEVPGNVYTFYYEKIDLHMFNDCYILQYTLVILTCLG